MNDPVYHKEVKVRLKEITEAHGRDTVMPEQFHYQQVSPLHIHQKRGTPNFRLALQSVIPYLLQIHENPNRIIHFQ